MKGKKKVIVTETTTTTGPDGKRVTRTVQKVTYVDDDTPVSGGGNSGKMNLLAALKASKQNPSGNTGNTGAKMSIADKLGTKFTKGLAACETGPALDNLDLKKFREDCLKRHNELRKKHHAGNLKINEDLNKIAQEYAEQLARTSSFNHSGNEYNGDNLGENLYMCGGRIPEGKDPVDSWYSEIKDYNFKKGGIKGCGHFTQVIWTETKELGIGVGKNGRSFYIVGNYYPAGNWTGEETKCVLPA